MPDPNRSGLPQGHPLHQPVLVREVLQILDLAPDAVVVDGTVGAGGHSRAILSKLGPDGKLIGLDRDAMMLGFAAQNLADPRCVLEQASYAQLPDVLDKLGIERVDRVLLDLGLSSDQLADRARGFGFQAGGTLDLRFDTTSGRPAHEWLADLDEEQLADIFFQFGEERHSRAIAREIVARRRSGPLRTAEELAEAVRAALSGRESSPAGAHPATRVFQALRIYVNAELEQLDLALERSIPSRLKEGGRAAIISFHSLEDRRVKDAFRSRERWQNLTSKPLTASPQEQRFNPRSRTAKLRAAVLKPLTGT